MIVTERLELIPATVDSTRAALEGGHPLGTALNAVVPSTWPPEFLDEPPLQHMLKRLEQGAEQRGWWLYFIVLTGGADARTLIGTAGYKGPPDPDGTVEIGYGIVRPSSPGIRLRSGTGLPGPRLRAAGG